MLASASFCNGQLKRHAYSQPKMGSPFNIIFYAPDTVQADEIAKNCFALVDSFNLVFSDYDPNSELSRLGASAGAGSQPVSKQLLDILALSEYAYRKSHHTFDITAGPVIRLWRKARKEKQLPDDRVIKEKMLLTGFDKMGIDTLHQAVMLAVKGMQLDLGGIAKGYIAQKVIDRLKQYHISSALADAGGDMAMSDAPPGSRGWTIGVNIPETTDDLISKKLSLHHLAVATSGDAYQYTEHNGKKYSHIIDPRTGYGITSQRNVTIIAADGATADWLATACSILPIAKAKRLVRKEKASLLIMELRQGKIIYHTTGHFSTYWKHS